MLYFTHTLLPHPTRSLQSTLINSSHSDVVGKHFIQEEVVVDDVRLYSGDKERGDCLRGQGLVQQLEQHCRARFLDEETCDRHVMTDTDRLNVRIKNI